MIYRVVNIAPQVLARRLPGGAVIVDLQTNEIFELNETSARVWEMLEEGSSPDVILTRLVEEFDVETVQAAAELNSLLADLERRGLITGA